MSAKPLVALMQPSAGYGCPYKKAARAFYRPSESLARLELEQGTSSTPRTFNMLLCDALNERKRLPITHLAMIHDDIGPEGFWLDVLMAELERTGADFLSAVVPIKNERGLTSTAVENPDDPWVVRRLTMREVFALPETFGAEDISWARGALLPNTGLWVARFSPAIWEAFADPGRDVSGQSGFRFINRIARMPDGDYCSQDIAEDWDLGRQLHSLGAKVLCTRKIVLEHGHPLWHTRGPWGDWQRDEGWFGWKQKTALARLGWKFPDDVSGWLTETEGQALARLAEKREVLEIGSFQGRSTICMAQTAAVVYSVDPHDGRATSEPGETYAAFRENLSRYGVGNVLPYVGTSETMLPTVPGGIDLAFIDGDHDREAVLRDAEMAAQKLRPHGLLAFHDYRVRPGEHAAGWDPGVTSAVDELLADGWALQERAGTIAVLRRKSVTEAAPCQP